MPNTSEGSTLDDLNLPHAPALPSTPERSMCEDSRSCHRCPVADGIAAANVLANLRLAERAVRAGSGSGVEGSYLALVSGSSERDQLEHKISEAASRRAAPATVPWAFGSPMAPKDTMSRPLFRATKKMGTVRTSLRAVSR
jgi:hypothetical protein